MWIIPIEKKFFFLHIIIFYFLLLNILIIVWRCGYVENGIVGSCYYLTFQLVMNGIFEISDVDKSWKSTGLSTW